CPEELFGELNLQKTKNELLKKIKRKYLELAHLTHPDHYENEKNQKLGQEAFARLRVIYEAAEKKIANRTYGLRQSIEGEGYDFSIQTRKNEYRINTTVAEGDLATIYGGYSVKTDSDLDDRKVIVKVVEDKADNDLMQCEARTLKLLHGEGGNNTKHLPKFIDQFKTSDGQLSSVLTYVHGHDLYSIREKYPDGIPQEHCMWIFRRVLSVLGFAHNKGIVHGNIEPTHLLVQADNHNVVLIDWCYAIYKPGQTGQGFKCYNEEYSAPEIAEKKPPLPAADLYSLGKCMIYLLGGNIEDDSMPDHIDDRLQRFIRFFTRPSPVQRAQDAWEMYGKIAELRKDIFGKHKFLEFKM
ncbi:MAG: serine/threonine protein kinase, partial [bacterium]